MTDNEKRKQMTDILKGIRFESMEEGKFYLYNALRISMHTSLSFNTLMSILGKPIHTQPDYGLEWGWRDLEYELLSNKYGIAAVRDYKNKKTEFVLRLPPPEQILFDYSVAMLERNYLGEPMHIQTERKLTHD